MSRDSRQSRIKRLAGNTDLVLDEIESFLTGVEGRVPPPAHPLDDLDREQRVLLPVQPPDPHHPQRLVLAQVARCRGRQFPQRLRDVRGLDSVAPSRPSHARARK